MSSKRSGWANWRAGYGGKRARDLPRPHNAKQFERFAESSPGPVASALWESDLVQYDESGQLRANEGATRAEALRVVESSKDASYSKDYLIKLEQEENAAQGGSGLTYEQAENRINRNMANRAKAVLLASKQGDIKLPRSQRERLQTVAEGNYLKTVYGRYSSGDRGTLMGVKGRARDNSEDNAWRAAEFREMVREHNTRYTGQNAQFERYQAADYSFMYR